MQGMALPEAQRWSHYPVTPLFSLNLLFLMAQLNWCAQRGLGTKMHP
jgi:hypothetical protein